MAEIASFGVNVDQNTRLAQNAQDTADDANAKNSANSQQIANINDPNYLSPFEKSHLEIQMDNFATIYAADKDIATSESIDFTAYEAAYQAYVTYMTPLITDMTTYSPIVRATFNNMVTAVQTEQKRFSTATQAQYDTAINQAKTDIANGQTKYKALQSEARVMESSVAGISDAADRAISSAGFASNAASEASQGASSAVASAMSAESNASSAVSIANSTASAFGPVKQKADSAVTAASSAVSIASSTASGFGKVSQKTDSAVAAANEATAGATTAESNAANALTSAASAQNVASSAVATANSTASDFGKVSQKTDSALTSAVNAQSAASDAVKQASSAAADSKDAKQIAGAVSQSYKTLTDGSTMTIAELENGLAAKLTKTDLDGYATQTWTQNKIKVTADDISGNLSSVKKTVDGQTTSINGLKADSSSFKSQFTTVNDNIGKNTTDIGTLQTDSSGFKAQFTTVNDTLGKHTTDIGTLQATSKGIQASVNSKASSDQLTLLSDQLTNKISDLSSSTNSQFTQIAGDINGLVKKGDVVNQFNLDTGGILLDTSGNSTKIVFSSPNIIFDSKNPVQIPNANIPGKLTGKTFEAGTITATTKINGADIEAPLIHSPNNSFKLDGNTGDIVGPSIHSADGAWGITANGKISGTSVTSSLIDISGDGSGPNFDAENVTPDTATGIYSRYKYTNPNVGFDVNGMGRKMYKNGYLVINGDTFLNRTIGDWSADGGGKYVYDTMYEANVIKMRAYNFTGSNVQTDDPSKTQGAISSRLDIQPSAITMGPDLSVSDPNILLDRTGRIKGGLIATNAAHSIGTTDGGDLYFMKMNKDATNVDGSSIPIHVKGLYTSNLGINNGHTISSFDGGGIYVEDTYNGGGNMVSLHVKKLYNSSLLSLKTDITTIDPNDALKTIANTDFRSYRFKTDDPSEPKSVSPILDDENQIPKYNTPNIFKSADGKSRNDGNILGYTALSVQALYAKIKDLTARLQKLEGVN